MVTVHSASPPLKLKVRRVVGRTETYQAARNVAASENAFSEKGFKMSKPFKIKQPATIINEPTPKVEPEGVGTIGDGGADDQLLTCTVLNVIAMIVVMAVSLGLITRVKVYQKYTEKQVQNSRLKMLVYWCEREVKEAFLTLEGRYISQKNDLLRLKSSYDINAGAVFRKAEAFRKWSTERDINTKKLVDEFRKQTRRTYALIAASWSKVKRLETRRSNMGVCFQRENVDIAFLESVIAATNSAVEKLFTEAMGELQTILGTTRDTKMKEELSEKCRIFLEDQDVWANGQCVEIITHLSSRTRKKLASRNKSKSSIKKSSVDSRSRSSIRSTSVTSSKSSKTPEPTTKRSPSDAVNKRTARDRSPIRPARGSSPGGAVASAGPPKKDSPRRGRASQSTGARVRGADNSSPVSPRRRCRSLEERSTRVGGDEHDQSNCKENGEQFKDVHTNSVKRLDDKSKSNDEVVEIQKRRRHGENKSTLDKAVMKMPFLCVAKPTADRRESGGETYLLTRKPRSTQTHHGQRSSYPGVKTSFVRPVGNPPAKCAELKQSVRGASQSKNSSVPEVKNQFYRTNKLAIDNSVQRVPTQRAEKDSSPRQQQRQPRTGLDERVDKHCAVESHVDEKTHVRGKTTKSAEDCGSAQAKTIGRSVSFGVGAGGRPRVDDGTRDAVSVENKVMFRDVVSREGKSRWFSRALLPDLSTGHYERGRAIHDEVDDEGNTVDDWYSSFYDAETVFSSEDETPLNSSDAESFIRPGYEDEFNWNGSNNRPNNVGGGTEDTSPSGQTRTHRNESVRTSDENAIPLRTSRPYFNFSSSKSCGANTTCIPSKPRGQAYRRSRSVNTSSRPIDADLDPTVTSQSQNESLDEGVLVRERSILDYVGVDLGHKTRSSSSNVRPRADSVAATRSRSHEVTPVGRQRSRLSSKSIDDEYKLLDSSDPRTMQSLFAECVDSSTEPPFGAHKGETTRPRTPFETHNVQPHKYHGIQARSIVKTRVSPRKPTDLQLQEKRQALTNNERGHDENVEACCRKPNSEANPKCDSDHQSSSRCLKRPTSARNREVDGVPHQLKRDKSNLSSSARSQQSQSKVRRVTDTAAPGNVNVDTDTEPVDVKLRGDSNIHCSLCTKTEHSAKSRPPFR